MRSCYQYLVITNRWCGYKLRKILPANMRFWTSFTNIQSGLDPLQRKQNVN